LSNGRDKHIPEAEDVNDWKRIFKNDGFVSGAISRIVWVFRFFELLFKNS